MTLAMQAVVPSHIFPDLAPERAVLEPLGVQVVDGTGLGAEARRAAVRQADALLLQYDEADAHFAAHGRWPTPRGPEQVIPGTGGERWSAIEPALRKGHRGLPRGSSLPRLLAKHRDASGG